MNIFLNTNFFLQYIILLYIFKIFLNYLKLDKGKKAEKMNPGTIKKVKYIIKI